MIEVTMNCVDGVNFIGEVKIVEPRDKRNGVFVEYVAWKIPLSSDFKLILKAFRLKKVGECIERKADVYAQLPLNYTIYKVIHFLLRAYWRSIRWLYDNGRVFKQIPADSCFSWSYFTPYCWYLKARARF